jgi:1-acyl-sn-glycerol-3-phosphate acyltransferase
MDLIKSGLVWLTAVCFLVILFPVTFVIWLLVLPFDRGRRVMHKILVYQSVAMSRIIPIWKIRIEGREKAIGTGACVLISNHQSILDILLVNCLGYRFKWVSKVENMKVPLLGWYLRMADYITVDRGNDESKSEMLARSLDCLRSGTSVMLFPEGTRSFNGEIGFFKRGAFLLAIQAGVPIVPVLLDGTSGILPKHGLVFGSGYRVQIRVLDPVLPEDFGTTDENVLAARFCSIYREELQKMRSGDPQK